MSVAFIGGVEFIWQKLEISNTRTRERNHSNCKNIRAPRKTEGYRVIAPCRAGLRGGTIAPGPRFKGAPRDEIYLFQIKYSFEKFS